MDRDKDVGNNEGNKEIEKRWQTDDQKRKTGNKVKDETSAVAIPKNVKREWASKSGF